MKTLYLLRHANAAQATPPAMSDFDRTLSGIGVRQARLVGRYMNENRLVPDFVHASAAVRTTETAQIILSALFGKIDRVASNFDKEIYAAPEEKLLAAIQNTNHDSRTLMLVAHNPGVADLAFALGKINNYEPGTLSIFTANVESWAGFSPQTAKLMKVFVPEV